MLTRDAQLCPAAELISGFPNSDVLVPQFVALSATHHAAKLIIGSARFKGLLGCLAGDGNVQTRGTENKASIASGYFKLGTAKKEHCALVYDVALPLERAGLLALLANHCNDEPSTAMQEL